MKRGTMDKPLTDEESEKLNENCKILTWVEWAFRQAEKGHNLDYVLIEAGKVLNS
jgi:hypothetical protein